MIVIARRHESGQSKFSAQLSLNISELTWQDGREKRTAKRLCVTNVTGLYSVFCCGLLLNLTVFWSFTKTRDLFKGMCSLAEILYYIIIVNTCHTGFAVFFPAPSSCVSSI